MRVIKSIGPMQKLALHLKSRGGRIGFVPTMGYLHAGHISLVHEARKRLGTEALIVVSIYVNPTQFAPHEDLSKYPRDIPNDLRLCREAGVDVVFLPDDRQMYFRDDPAGYSTYVVEEQLARGMEGASRPTHFRGVTTVVAKLFNIVLPDVSVFGAKDFQQAAVIQRMVRDLNMPVKIVVAPTMREADGLAMSSRNKYLSAEERRGATVLSRAIRKARELVKGTAAPLAAARLKRELAKLIATEPLARLDYLECFDPATLQPTARAGSGTHLALAVFFGRTRLIDNGRL